MDTQDVYEFDSLMHLPLPEDNENVTDYKFPRFAATHFQNNATHVHIRRPIKEPLLPLKNDGDQLVSSLSTSNDIAIAFIENNLVATL